MTYDVKIIDSIELSDGQVAFLARSNDDPRTDSWATVTIDPDGDVDALIDQTIADHKQRVAKLHAARERARTKMNAVKAQEKL